MCDFLTRGALVTSEEVRSFAATVDEPTRSALGSMAEALASLESGTQKSLDKEIESNPKYSDALTVLADYARENC